MYAQLSTVSVVGLLAAWALHARLPALLPKSYDARPSPPSKTEEMWAVAYDRHGDASVLKFYDSYPRPVVLPHQVLIKVHYSALNPCDFKIRRNKITWPIVPKPKIPGEDVAGTIEELGSDVMLDSRFQKGDRVASMLPITGSRWGAIAEYVAVDASFVAKVGDNTTLQQAAAVPLVSLTTVQAINKLNGDYKSILIHAGAGGLGSFAVQYAKKVLKMETVVTTASSAKFDLVKEMGADLVVDYRREAFEDVVSDMDVVFDPMSWSYESRSFQVLKKSGHYLNIGSSDWAFDNGFEQANGMKSIVGLVRSKIQNFISHGSIPKYDIIAVEPNGHQLQVVLDLINNGTIRPIIDRKFSSKEVPDAYRYLEKGGATGKILIDHLSVA